MVWSRSIPWAIVGRHLTDLQVFFGMPSGQFKVGKILNHLEESLSMRSWEHVRTCLWGRRLAEFQCCFEDFFKVSSLRMR